jgi:hypothetical protein
METVSHDIAAEVTPQFIIYVILDTFVADPTGRPREYSYEDTEPLTKTNAAL